MMNDNHIKKALQAQIKELNAQYETLEKEKSRFSDAKDKLGKFCDNLSKQLDKLFADVKSGAIPTNRTTLLLVDKKTRLYTMWSDKYIAIMNECSKFNNQMFEINKKLIKLYNELLKVY